MGDPVQHPSQGQLIEHGFIAEDCGDERMANPDFWVLVTVSFRQDQRRSAAVDKG
jgi:hypothetical protein